MDNSRFSCLVYRLIDKPDRWQEDYIDTMHQTLDETDAIDGPENFSELEIGERLLGRINHTNKAFCAFGAVFDENRFKMIILDHDFKLIHHNKNAKALYTCLQQSTGSNRLNPLALKKVQQAAKRNKTSLRHGNNDGLYAIDCLRQNGEQLFLRSIDNFYDATEPSRYYLLLTVDQSSHARDLNPDLVDRYKLTQKEQSALSNLVHGKSISQIAKESFVSENTIKTHLQALYRKTNTQSQATAVNLVLNDESQILDGYFGTPRYSNDNASMTHSKDRFVTLSHGQRIAYREYGPADGDPIIVCHNGYGCRASIPNDYQAICERQHKRVIIPDRPGFGLTPYVSGGSDTWNAMLREFIDQLDLQSYELLGNCLGSAIAINFAVEADNRLIRVRLSSPIFVNTRHDSDFLIGVLAPVARLLRASKKLTRKMYRLWLKSVKINVSVDFRNMLVNNLGSEERLLFQDNKSIEVMLDGFELASKHSLKGMTSELTHCLSPHNLDLSKISVPVDLWWGSEDQRISLDGVKNIASQLDKATLNIREGYSEHMYYALFEDIIS